MLMMHATTASIDGLALPRRSARSQQGSECCCAQGTLWGSTYRGFVGLRRLKKHPLPSTASCCSVTRDTLPTERWHASGAAQKGDATFDGPGKRQKAGGRGRTSPSSSRSVGSSLAKPWQHHQPPGHAACLHVSSAHSTACPDGQHRPTIEKRAPHPAARVHHSAKCDQAGK
jgi:hypothetical protein